MTRTTSWLAVLGCMPAVAVARTAHAEIDLATVEDVEALSLADLLERPIVTASRYSQRPASSPMLVSSVDAEQITALGYRTLGDALRSLRGVYQSNDRNYSYLGLRGFGIPGDYNTRIALSIDGHRMNDPIYGQAPTGLELGLPLIAIERIELLRGGAWSVYGQSALLGAVQVITANGATRPGLQVRATSNVTAETYGDPAGRPPVAPRAQDVAASYGAVSRGVDVFVAANYIFDPGLAALYMPELATADLACVEADLRPRECDGVVRGGDREEVGGAYLALRGKRFAFRSLASRRRKLASTGAYGGTLGDPLQTQDERLYGDATYKIRGAKLDLDGHVALDYAGYHGDYPYDSPREGYATWPESRVVNQDFGHSVWLTGELRGRYKVPRLGRHLSEIEIAGGTETQWQRGHQLNYDAFPGGSTTYTDRSDRARIVALSGHAMARAFDRLVGFAAIRGDYYPDAFGLTVNPQAGVVLDLEEHGRIRGSASRGFRPPNLYELHWASNEQVSSTLLPEHSETRELSYERYLGRRVRLLTIAYTQAMTDLIRLTTNEAGERLFVNAGGATTYGMEAELEGRWDAIQLRTS